MKFIKNLPAFLVKFKKENGRLPQTATIRFLFDLDRIARKFERKGREDGAQGKPALGDGAFAAWGTKSFGGDRDFDVIVSLMKNAYMDGYREGRVKYEK